MRQWLKVIISRTHRWEFEDHHVMACGYLITGILFNGHSTIVMTVAYVWVGVMHTHATRMAHMAAFLPKLRRTHQPTSARGPRPEAA